MTSPRPPRFATWLLGRCLPGGATGDSILGDLYEEYIQRRGGVRRYLWYWRHAMALSTGYLFKAGSRSRRLTRHVEARRRFPLFGSDIRHAFRIWRKRPGYAALAVATLGLGIGAATAIVSVVDRALLRSLPYPDAHELVTVWNTFPAWRGHEVLDALWDRVHISYPEYRDWRDGQEAYQSVAIYSTGYSTLTGIGNPAVINFGTASASLFQLLGTKPIVGRTFSQDEEADGGSKVALVSYGFWVQRLGADANAVERTVTVDGESYAIVGVLPPEFRLRALTSGRMGTDVWVPAGIFGEANDRGHHIYEGIARLKPGVSLDQAAADAGPLLRGPASPDRMGVRVLSRQSEEVSSSRGPLMLLLGSAGLLMLIASANVATLFTAEATNRRHELATRGALGASRGRLVMQLLFESGSIGVLGASVGVVIAFAGVQALLGLAPPALVLPESVPVDLRVLSFAAVLGVTVGVAFGVGPALAATRGGMGPVLYRRTTTGDRSGARLQRLMVGAESALSVVLLVIAALLGRSLIATRAVDPGFRGENLVALSLPLSGPRTQPTQLIQFARELVSEVGVLPGVTAVTGANAVPFSRRGGSSSFQIEGRPVAPGEKMPEAHRRTVLPGFHETLDIPVIQGRAISEQDVENGRPVVVVSSAMAGRYWPNESPIGAGIIRDNRRWEVVGVVGDILHGDLTAEKQSTYYFSFFQQPPRRFWLLVQSSLPPGDLLPGVRGIIADVAPEVAVERVERLETLVRESTAGARYRTILVTVFGACSLLLAAVGMFGVTTRSVASRRRELGIRLALGAKRRHVTRAVMAKETRAMQVGVVVGLIVAAASVRTIATFLFGVSPWDPVAFAIAGIGLATVGLVASWVPARITSAVEPGYLLQVD